MSPVDLSSLDDVSLVDEVARGSNAALAEVYRRHSDAVFGLARRLLRDATLAEDIAQEVFLRLWNNPEKFDGSRGALRSYLLAHTHGRSIDLIRSESSRRTREDNEARLEPIESANVEEEVLTMALSDKVRQALAQLNDGERKAIELAYFGGQTYRQVAETLGEPEGTIKSRIRVGMKRLRVVLDASGVTP